MFIKTPRICLVSYLDKNSPDEMGIKDLGNFYEDTETGDMVLITTKENAQKFGHLVGVPVYVKK